MIPIIKPFKSNFDEWSFFHAIMGYCILSVIWPIGYFKACLISACAVIGWETIDVIWALIVDRYDIRNSKIDMLFDRRGASWGDALLGILGIAFWYLQFIVIGLPSPH
jgi:hypothetical protein